MRLLPTIVSVFALLALPVSAADPATGLAHLRALPHADVARLIGSWQVAEMDPVRMIYEFQAGTMAMHGK